MASCTQIKSSIQAYVDGELKNSEQVVVEQHLAQCNACKAILKRHQATSALLFEGFAPYRLQYDMTPAIMAHLPEISDRHRKAREVTYRAKHPEQRRSYLFMRFLPALAPVLILVLAAALFRAWPVNEPLSRPIGMVLAQSGQVLQSQEADTRRTGVKLERKIGSQDRFETGEDALLMLGLAGPSEVKLDSNTRVKIAHAREVSVERGRAWFNVSKGKEYFRVITPNGTVTVFGTTFSVAVDEMNTTVQVASGEVQVENGVTFQSLHAGQELGVIPEAHSLVPRSIEAQTAMAWADSIEANQEAASRFTRDIEPYNEVLRAKQVFVVNTGANAIQSILLKWRPDGLPAGHSGYFVYVSDDDMQPLFKAHIKASVFNDQRRNHYEVTAPEGRSIREVKVLHINLLPDRSGGSIETSFTEVLALKG